MGALGQVMFRPELFLEQVSFHDRNVTEAQQRLEGATKLRRELIAGHRCAILEGRSTGNSCLDLALAQESEDLSADAVRYGDVDAMLRAAGPGQLVLVHYTETIRTYGPGESKAPHWRFMLGVLSEGGLRLFITQAQKAAHNLHGGELAGCAIPVQGYLFAQEESIRGLFGGTLTKYDSVNIFEQYHTPPTSLFNWMPTARFQAEGSSLPERTGVLYDPRVMWVIAGNDAVLNWLALKGFSDVLLQRGAEIGYAPAASAAAAS